MWICRKVRVRRTNTTDNEVERPNPKNNTRESIFIPYKPLNLSQVKITIITTLDFLSLRPKRYLVQSQSRKPSRVNNSNKRTTKKFQLLHGFKNKKKTVVEFEQIVKCTLKWKVFRIQERLHQKLLTIRLCDLETTPRMYILIFSFWTPTQSTSRNLEIPYYKIYIDNSKYKIGVNPLEWTLRPKPVLLIFDYYNYKIKQLLQNYNGKD